MNRILLDDIATITSSKSVNWEALKDSTVLVTGFKGMVGSYFVRTCLYLNDHMNYNIHVIGLDMNANNVASDILDHPNMKIVIQDVTKPFEFEDHVDYVLHAASPASPLIMKNNPVGTIAANTLGTWNALVKANECNAKGFVFISSREIYGQPYDNQEEFLETTYGLVDHVTARACYPEGKKAAETMCVCYKEQYGLNTKIARLAHTYGPGMSIYDGRVQADFLKNALFKEDIVMKSTGAAIRTYTYIADVTEALFMIMLNGTEQVYNISDPNNKVSIKELAETIVNCRPEDGLKLVIDLPPEALKGVSPFTLGILNSDRIQALGWKARYNVLDGFRRTLDFLEIEKEEGRL